MRTIINDDALIKKGYFISTDPHLLNFDLIFKYLSEDSYWAKGLTAEKLRKAMCNSLCFGVYKAGSQAGFARVVTDKATFAYICDLFILPGYRKQGLSKWLVQSIINYPEMKGLRRWTLATADAHGLYSQFGFVAMSRTDRWMEIFTPYTTTK